MVSRSGSSGSGQHRLKWRRSPPALTASCGPAINPRVKCTCTAARWQCAPGHGIRRPTRESAYCAATLRKDSKSRSNATEDPTKVSCPYCVQLMRPQACSQTDVPCSFCTGIITRPKPGGDVQDVKITGIPLENARLAIRLVGATPRKILSEAQKAALATGVRFTSRDDKSPHRGQVHGQ